MATTYTDVLIIGAGPSGLFAACELARHGVRARLIERTRTPHRQTRATAIQPATLEALARASLVETFLDNGVKIRRVRMFGEGCGVLSTASLEKLDSPFPFECSLPQWRTEELLTARLSSLGGEVERGVEASSIDVTDDGVVVKATKADGVVETIETRYLIGAGGAHGPTRHAMGETLAGETYPGGYWAADLRIRGSTPVDEARLFVSAAGAALLAPLPEGRFLLIMDVPPSHELRQTPDASLLSLEAGRRMGGGVELDDLRWVSAFAMHKRMASRLGGRNWFLLGDAAHLSSVFGGEGLNAGLMDAADLAWKLALVIKGPGRQALLDSYAIERSIADRHAVAVSDEIHGGIADLVAAFRSGSPPAPAAMDPDEDRAFQRRRCMLDVSYAGSVLIGERRFMKAGWPTGPAPGERYPDRVQLSGETHQLVAFRDRNAALDAVAARWRELVEVICASEAGLCHATAGVPPGGALLIRPDGYIGFRVDLADAEAVAAIDAHLSTYLQPAGS